MRIGVLGTGMVGKALATRLTELDHEVMMGGRSGESGADWASGAGGASGTFAEAAAHGEISILAVRGDVALGVIGGEVAAALDGKVLLDVSNPLDFSQGMPPRLIPELSNTTSLGEAVQAALPGTRVVKTLNTVNADVMVHPERVPGTHDIFVAGEDAEAKARAVAILREFGWGDPIDLGGIDAARGLESYLPFWVRLWGAVGHANFNIAIAGRPDQA